MIGLAFRGNCTENISSIDIDSNKNYYRSNSEGNFLGLVKLLAGENSDLAEHIRKCKENRTTNQRGNQPTYLSHNFVNKALFVIRKLLVSKIVNEIKESGGRFGILIDGSQDITSQEQLSAVARYIDSSNEIVERTILFFDAKNTSGEALFELLHVKLTEIGLTISNIVGCSFDGASNMRSENIGLSAYIQENNTGSIYIWCLSHRYNLVIKKSIKSSNKIKAILQTAEDSAKLFRSSYIKMNIWTDVLKTTPQINSMRKLKLIGTTRWSSAQNAINTIISTQTNLFVLIKSLLRVCNLHNLDRGALVHASSILNSWLNYENIVTTFILDKIFLLTVPVTKYLQKCGLNILDAVKLLKESKDELKKGKTMLRTYIQEAEKFVQETNNLLSNDPEIVALDCDCRIILPEKEQKKEIDDEIIDDFQEFIERLLSEIDTRILLHFDDPENIYCEISNLDILKAKDVFSHQPNVVQLGKLCKSNNILSESMAIDELKMLAVDFFTYQNRPQFEAVFNKSNFMHSDDESIDFDQELINFVIEDETDIEETSANIQNIEFHHLNKKICYCCECVLKYINVDDARKKKYENIHKIYQYVAMLPITQVKCERDFSKLKITKNRLRSNMSEKLLENLMIISVESDMFETIDLDQIIDEIIATSPNMSR